MMTTTCTAVCMQSHGFGNGLLALFGEHDGCPCRCLITSWLSAANSQARANILALRALSPQLMALPWPLVLACTSLHHHLAAPPTPESHH